MHRRAGLYERVIIFKLGAEVDPFLQIGLARCELATDREVSSPGSTPTRHGYFELCLKVLREELLADFLHPSLQWFVHSMTDNVKEAAVAACLSNLSCDFVTIFFSAYQRTDVDDGNMRISIVCHAVHIAAIYPWRRLTLC